VAHAREEQLQPTPVTYIRVTPTMLLKAEETIQKINIHPVPENTATGLSDCKANTVQVE